MQYKLKLVYNFDDNQYNVFAEGLAGIEGWGDTEEDAIGNFYANLYKEMITCNGLGTSDSI